jgi:hypothetical protein
MVVLAFEPGDALGLEAEDLLELATGVLDDLLHVARRCATRLLVIAAFLLVGPFLRGSRLLSPLLPLLSLVRLGRIGLLLGRALLIGACLRLVALLLGPVLGRVLLVAGCLRLLGLLIALGLLL